MLERVKGALAPLGGSAALDPPSALPCGAPTGNAEKQTALGRAGASRLGQVVHPDSRAMSQERLKSARSRLSRRPRRAWLAASGRRNPGKASMKSGLSISASIWLTM